ncbi:MAG TPA: methionyl-tRNA formyltransferase, partial [Acidimicrobiia bacterium]|nr:methionyl-tRNA formyltransferase [Acidimicrobiia bacterium]
MRVAFFGTPAPAVPVLEALRDAHEVALVVTQPERRRGRGASLVPSPVQAAASAAGLPVRTPAKAREVTDELVAAGVQVGVVAAFGQLLPTSLLDAVPSGLLNVHLSVLPRWRGAAPVERAILAGDEETGVTIMEVDAQMDHGPILSQSALSIEADEDAVALSGRLSEAGA